MLVPPDQPCSECGHPRRDHDLTADLEERCGRCGCRAAASDGTTIVWDPNGPAHPFDWRFALATFLMRMDDDQNGLFADTIHEWRPPYELRDGEVEDLRLVEKIVRDLVARYGPKRPRPARLTSRDVATDTAEVDVYEERKNAICCALLRLMFTDEWRSFFPKAEHERVEEGRRIIAKWGGGDRLEERM